MDFDKEIKLAISSSTYINLNSITAAPTVGTPFSGYFVEGVSYANSGVSGYVDALAQRDGYEADIAVLGSRSIQMVVQVYGSSAADFHDKLNAVNAALEPYPSYATATDGFRALDFFQPTVSYTAYSATGIPMRINVRPSALPAYNLANNRTTPRTSDRGLSTKVSLSLVAKDPRKISQNSTTGVMTAGTTTTLTNNGNYITYPTITFVNAGSQQTATISSSIFTTVLVLPAATTVVLNSSDRKVTVGTTLRMDLIGGATTTFPYLLAGARVITLSSLTSVTTTYSFNEAWL